jgi:hypothetical protein
LFDVVKRGLLVRGGGGYFGVFDLESVDEGPEEGEN